MSLVGLLAVLIIIGVLLYVVNTLIPMDGKIRTIINIVVVLFVCLWLISATGLLEPINTIRIGTIR